MNIGLQIVLTGGILATLAIGLIVLLGKDFPIKAGRLGMLFIVLPILAMLFSGIIAVAVGAIVSIWVAPAP